MLFFRDGCVNRVVLSDDVCVNHVLNNDVCVNHVVL